MLINDDNFFSDKPPVVKGAITAEYITQLKKGGFSKVFQTDTKTQKAKGIFFLQDRSPQVQLKYGWKVPKHLLFPAGYNFAENGFNYPIFARPCPTVPRHGFVDSTVCENSEQLNALSKQTLAVEPNAEILITKPVDCSYSAIINGGVITFAPGNDGATAGKGCRYFYISDDPLSKHIELDPSILLEGEVPFYEMVFAKKGEPKLVQVRSAPGTPHVKDYVPQKVEVKKIIKAEGDLLDWEDLLKKADPSTTIIDHIGGSLSSHYAIHAVINRIPIFTTYLPELGSTLEATVENSELDENDRVKFSRAFVAGFNSAPYIKKNLRYIGKGTKNSRPVLLGILELALATLHNFSTISLHKDYEILGLALGLFVRATFSVSMGEARHSPDKNVFTEFFKACSSDREACYDTMFANSSETCLKDIETIFYIFRDVAWNGGFGGKKWASCTKSSIDLFNAGIKGDITNVVELFNRVINEEHNGGKYLNKIIDIRDFDEVAKDPSHYALKKLPAIIDLLYVAGEYMVNKKAEWEPSLEYFKEIKLLSHKEVKPGCTCKLCTTELTNLKINSVGVIADSALVNWDKFKVDFTDVNSNTIQSIFLPVKGMVPSASLPCSAVSSMTLAAVPYNWSFGGFKVSKAKIAQKVNKEYKAAQELLLAQQKTQNMPTNVDVDPNQIIVAVDGFGTYITHVAKSQDVWYQLPKPILNTFGLIPYKQEYLIKKGAWWTCNGSNVISAAKVKNLLKSKNKKYDVLTPPNISMVNFTNNTVLTVSLTTQKDGKFKTFDINLNEPLAVSYVDFQSCCSQPSLVLQDDSWCLPNGTKIIGKKELDANVNKQKKEKADAKKKKENDAANFSKVKNAIAVSDYFTGLENLKTYFIKSS